MATRILDWPSIVPYVDDSKLVVERGMHGATGNVYCGLHEFADMAFLLHMLRPDDCFVDIGANVGSYTVLGSAVVGASSVSIEPVPATFELLQRNIRINNIDSLVTSVCCAMGRQEETREMSVDQGPANRIVQSDYLGAKSSVSVRPLDAILEGRASTLWKMDVEGFELDALAGARDSIAAPSLLAIIIETSSDQAAAIMRSHGFERAIYDPLRRELSTPTGAEASNNQLWVRNPELVAARCRGSRTYRVLSASI